ncbi:MAG: DUF2953 domain-containing protein [Ruminococcaceae bacterium]|nr:DUF2953 domain-containing protein [Oscillospiraceae bacterium]
MIALCIIFAILVIIALTPVGVKAKYDENGPAVWAKIGLIRVKLYPITRKEKTKEKKPEKKKETQEMPQQKAAKGGNLDLIKQILPHGLTAVKRFFKGLGIDKLTVYFQVADEDPAKAAMQYGYGWAAIGIITGLIENAFTVRNRDLQVFVNFEENAQKRIYVLAEMSIQIWRLFRIGIGFGIEFLKIIIKNRNNKVEVTESTSANA